MPHPQFDRHKVFMKALSERPNKTNIERDKILADLPPQDLDAGGIRLLNQSIERIKTARKNGKPVMLTFGAHSIKNCLAPVFIDLMEKGFVTHLSTNGAGVIHDWELSFQGETSEDVQKGVKHGEFGNWQETGFNINLAINVGAYEGKGYGESVGAFIMNDGVMIPSIEDLKSEIKTLIDSDPQKAAAASDLIYIIKRFELSPGKYEVKHPFKQYSVQAAAYRLGIPFTSHPMIGHDIIYNHPMNYCALLGRAAERDFLSFAHSVNQIDGGVYLSIGSAVMSPMIFEKSLSISQNVAIQQGKHFDNHYILVVDLAKSDWDWSQGEPPEDNPAYYLRYNKSFSRMGGTMRYLSADNRDVLLYFAQNL